MFHQVRSSGVRAKQIVDALRDVPNLAFEEWEEPLIDQCAARHPNQNMVALGEGDEIVGALLGGQSLGTRSLNHMGFVKKVRRSGWGGKLAEQSVSDARGNCRVFYLMTTKGNDDAVRFWKRYGFVERAPALERDLDPEASYETSDLLNPFADDATVRRILKAGMGDDAHYVLSDLATEAAVAFPLRDAEDECCGLMLAGTCGYRGLLRAIVPFGSPTRSSLRWAFQSSYAWIASQGRYRIHNLWETQAEREMVFEEGFTEEPTYICSM